MDSTFANALRLFCKSDCLSSYDCKGQLISKCPFSGVLLGRQLIKCQLSCQMFDRKLLFLVCCFFSVIWNVSKLNVLKTKLKIKLPKWIFWESIFEIWEHQCLLFLCFHYWDLMTNNWLFINCRRKRTLFLISSFWPKNQKKSSGISSLLTSL